MKLASRLLALCTCFVFAASCSEQVRSIDPNRQHDVIDRDRVLDRQDFKDLHKLEEYVDSNTQVTANVLEPPIPDLAEILAAPKPPKIAQTQLVSVAVTDDVPLKDVLIELARLADVEVEVDPSITGGIIFTAKDRPFNEVIDRIANFAGLRYRVQNNVLRIESDLPYIKTYTLDMLNERAAQAQMATVSTEGGSGGSAPAAASTSSASSAGGGSRDAFWNKFDEGIKNILGYVPASMVSTTDQAVQPSAPVAANPGAPGQAAPAPAPIPVAIPRSQSGNSNNQGSFYTINRQAGTLTASATERQHELIQQFIRAIDQNVSSQVLIEAKIVEVSLNDRFQTGIDWSKLGTANDTVPATTFAADFSNVVSPTGFSGARVGVIKNNFLGGLDISAAVNLLDQFGTTRALSSPRLNAMNNQQAVLSFVENLIYFDVECEVTDAVAGVGGAAGTPAKIEVTTEKKEQPLGIVLSLMPSINKESGEITLGVRPTLTRFVKPIPDPGFELCKASALSQSGIPTGVVSALLATESVYPQIEKRELDSIMKIKSGQVMVIGGLLEDRITNTDTGVPGVSEVPYFGNLFKGVDKSNQKKELVILIRATIVDSQGYMDAADKGIYEKFIQDPRPIMFPPPQ